MVETPVDGVRGSLKPVLAIDDDPNVALLLDAMLKEKGYDVIPAPDGKEGLARAIKLRPYFIMLDIMMPEMDGWLVLKELKKLDALKDTPVVIISIIDEKNMGFKLGAFDYIVKPFGIDEIYDVVDRIEKSLEQDSNGGSP